MRHLLFLASPLLLLSLTLGCGGENPGGDEAADDHAGDSHAADSHAGHADEHVHEGGDALFWQREELEHGECLISLGHHGIKIYADHNLEPAVSIMRGDQPVGDAEVFVTLLDGDKQVIVEEAQCAYEPPTTEEPAHYAQAVLAVPADATKVVLRYRVEIPAAESFTLDVPVDVSSHD